MRRTMMLLVGVSLLVPAGAEASTLETRTSDLALQDAAVRAIVEVSQPTTCLLRAAIAGPVLKEWAGLILAETPEQVEGFAFESGTYGAAQAHVEGALNTRDLASGQRWESMDFTFQVDVQSSAMITAASNELAPWPESLRAQYPDPAPGRHAIELRVECFGEASVRFEAGLDALITASNVAYTGAGVTALGNGAYLGSRQEADIDAPSSAFRFLGSFDPGVTRVDVDRPSGSSEHVFAASTATSIVRFDDGPGSWAVAIDRVSAVGAFLSLLAGFEPVDSLDQIAA